jgi:starch synthase (maltosyl-transferring)
VLQRGGPAAFRLRAALAALLSPLWGIYSGFELCEGAAVPGTEEYLDSEKYEIRVRHWDAPGHIKDWIARLNRIRRDNPALQHMRTLRFHEADDDHVLFFGKTAPAGDNAVLAAVNLDPYAGHGARLRVPLGDLGLAPDETYELTELLAGGRRLARGPDLTVALEPGGAAAFRVGRWRRREQDFDYFA